MDTDSLTPSAMRVRSGGRLPGKFPESSESLEAESSEEESGIEVGRGDVALESDETSTASSEAGNKFRAPSRKRPKRRR